MKVTISNGGGSLTVHRAGCRDIKRERCDTRWTIDIGTQKEAVIDVYDPGDFDYDPDTQWEDFNDLQYKPCVNLPTE